MFEMRDTLKSVATVEDGLQKESCKGVFNQHIMVKSHTQNLRHSSVSRDAASCGKKKPRFRSAVKTLSQEQKRANLRVRCCGKYRSRGVE